MSLNVLSIGGSRNIGYYTTIRLLNAGATVTYLLRSTSVFDHDEVIQKFLKDGKIQLVKGDALVIDDVRRVWQEAGKNAPVDYLLFSVGGKLQFTFGKGFFTHPPDLVTQCWLNTLCTLPTPPPHIVTISSTGLTATSHRALPLALKPIYSKMLAVPHRDKVGAERVIAHVTGWPWDSAADGEPGEDIMGKGNWREREGLLSPGTLKNVLVVRPALLSDGECVADKLAAKGKDKAPYRVSTQELRGYTVSRKDVAHFIAEAILVRWDEFRDKIVNVSY